MSSPLSTIEIEKRRQVAATLGLFAMLFIAIGAVAATGASTAIIKGFVAVALVVALVLGLLAWGVLHSIRLDLAERRLDAALAAAVTASGSTVCGCGVDHDPDELHVANCRHDGSGTDCSHSCDTCVLAAMRPSPYRTRAERAAYTAEMAPSKP